MVKWSMRFTGTMTDAERDAFTAPILAKLNAAAAKALDDENVRKRLLDLGSDIPKAEARTQAALAALVKSEIEKWSAVLKPATN